MPWGRIDDSLYDHPKLDALGRQKLPAIGLHTLTLSWCNRWLTDGAVSCDRVVKLGGTVKLAETLVAAGLWEQTRSGYQVHDYLQYNDSRAEVEERREIEREKKRRGRNKGSRGVSRDEAGRFVELEPPGEYPGEYPGESPDVSPDVSPGEYPGESPATRPIPARPGLSRPIPSASTRADEVDFGAAEDPLETVETWLAQHGAGNIRSGSVLETDLARLVDKHGASVLITRFEALAPQDDAAQFIYGARNGLHPIPRGQPQDDVAALPDVETLRAAAHARRAREAGGTA
jgi:hypothetical protein